ncbi:hypothetical protein ACPVPU_14780 [Sphingomonas sp. CJ99]
MVKLNYQCCYCDHGIAKHDADAVRIVLSGLWGGSGGAVQEIFAHRQCAFEKFGAALSPSVPFDIQVFGPD